MCVRVRTVCCTPALSAAARVHLVRWHSGLASLQLRRQSRHHYVADGPAASHGRRLPADATQSRRSARPDAVYEVYVPQRVVRRLLIPADTRVDERRQLRRRLPGPPTAARTTADRARVAHCSLCHGSVCVFPAVILSALRVSFVPHTVNFLV